MAARPLLCPPRLVYHKTFERFQLSASQLLKQLLKELYLNKEV